MKKNTTIILITMVISVALTLVGVKVYEKIKISKLNDIAGVTGVKNVREINYEIPSFKLTVNGIYDTVIDSNDLSDLKKYYIETVMDDGIYKFLYSYEGIRLNELLNLYQLEDFKEVTIKSGGRLQVTFLKEEITDNIYLTFSKDGYANPTSEAVSLVAPDYMARYSISQVVELTFD